MAETNHFASTVEALFKGMESFVTTKTVVGDPIELNGATILPLVDVTFGCGAGATGNKNAGKNGAGGGMSGKITPSAVLGIQNGSTRLVNIKNQDTVAKILDMVPDLVNQFVKNTDGSDHSAQVSDQEAVDAVKQAEKEKEIL